MTLWYLKVKPNFIFPLVIERFCLYKCICPLTAFPFNFTFKLLSKASDYCRCQEKSLKWSQNMAPQSWKEENSFTTYSYTDFL